MEKLTEKVTNMNLDEKTLIITEDMIKKILERLQQQSLGSIAVLANTSIADFFELFNDLNISADESNVRKSTQEEMLGSSPEFKFSAPSKMFTPFKVKEKSVNLNPKNDNINTKPTDIRNAEQDNGLESSFNKLKVSQLPHQIFNSKDSEIYLDIEFKELKISHDIPSSIPGTGLEQNCNTSQKNELHSTTKSFEKSSEKPFHFESIPIQKSNDNIKPSEGTWYWGNQDNIKVEPKIKTPINNLSNSNVELPKNISFAIGKPDTASSMASKSISQNHRQNKSKSKGQPNLTSLKGNTKESNQASTAPFVTSEVPVASPESIIHQKEGPILKGKDQLGADLNKPTSNGKTNEHIKKSEVHDTHPDGFLNSPRIFKIGSSDSFQSSPTKEYQNELQTNIRPHFVVDGIDYAQRHGTNPISSSPTFQSSKLQQPTIHPGDSPKPFQDTLRKHLNMHFDSDANEVDYEKMIISDEDGESTTENEQGFDEPIASSQLKKNDPLHDKDGKRPISAKLDLGGTASLNTARPMNEFPTEFSFHVGSSQKNSVKPQKKRIILQQKKDSSFNGDNNHPSLATHDLPQSESFAPEESKPTSKNESQNIFSQYIFGVPGTTLLSDDDSETDEKSLENKKNDNKIPTLSLKNPKEATISSNKEDQKLEFSKTSSIKIDSNANAKSNLPSQLKSDESLAKLANVYSQQGKDQYASKAYTSAYESFTQSLKLAPAQWSERTTVLGNRAATLMMMGRLTEVVNDCDEALRLDSGLIKLHVRKGRALLRLGHYTVADEAFSRVMEYIFNPHALSQPPTKTTINDKKTIEYHKLEAKSGIKDIEKLKEMQKNLICTEGNQDFESVLKITDSILTLSPYNRTAQVAKANSLLMLRRYNDAKDFIEEIITSTHSSVQSLVSHPSVMNLPSPILSELQWIEAKTDNSIMISMEAVVQAVLCMGKEMGLLYLNVLKNHEFCRTNCSEIMSKISTLLATLSTRLNPEDLNEGWSWVTSEVTKINEFIHYKNLSDYFFKEKNFQNALQNYSVALKVDKSAKKWNAILYSNRAAANISLGLYVEAITDCHNSIATDPDFSKAYLRRARAYRSINKIHECIRDYRRYLCSDPIPTDLAQVQQELDSLLDQRKSDARASQQTKSNKQSYEPYPKKESKPQRRTENNYYKADKYPFYSFGDEDSADDEYDEFNKNGSAKYGYSGAYTSRSTSADSERSKDTLFGRYGSKFHDQPNNKPQDYSRSSSENFKSSKNQSGKYTDSKKFTDNNTQNENISCISNKDDHYSVLGVQPHATEKDIRVAYKKLALQYHPDKNKDERAEDTFKLISQAYMVLSDKIQRKEFDQKHFDSNRYYRR